MRLLAVFLLPCLAACGAFPQGDAAGPGTATPPPLLPIEELIAQVGTPAPDPGPALAARAARLKARAGASVATPPAP